MQRVSNQNPAKNSGNKPTLSGGAEGGMTFYRMTFYRKRSLKQEEDGWIDFTKKGVGHARLEEPASLISMSNSALATLLGLWHDTKTEGSLRKRSSFGLMVPEGWWPRDGGLEAWRQEGDSESSGLEPPWERRKEQGLQGQWLFKLSVNPQRCTSRKAAPLKPPHTVPPIGDQCLNTWGGRGHFSSRPPKGDIGKGYYLRQGFTQKQMLRQGFLTWHYLNKSKTRPAIRKLSLSAMEDLWNVGMTQSHPKEGRQRPSLCERLFSSPFQERKKIPT